jgi:hypothetical protein
MTAVETAPADSNDPMAGRKAAARAAYRASLAEGVPLTGAELGRRFGLSPRWGRPRVAEVHAEAAAGNGTHPPRAHPGDARNDIPAPLKPVTHEHNGSTAGRAEAASTWTNGSSPPSGLRSGSEPPSAIDAPGAVSAATLADSDPEEAFSLAHDAARRAATALVVRQGLRLTTAGGHLAVADAINAQVPSVASLKSERVGRSRARGRT